MRRIERLPQSAALLMAQLLRNVDGSGLMFMQDRPSYQSHRQMMATIVVITALVSKEDR